MALPACRQMVTLSSHASLNSRREAPHSKRANRQPTKVRQKSAAIRGLTSPRSQQPSTKISCWRRRPRPKDRHLHNSQQRATELWQANHARIAHAGKKSCWKENPLQNSRMAKSRVAVESATSEMHSDAPVALI